MAATPLILAAGASTRMGRPKAGLSFGRSTALELILGTCAAAGLDPPVVVVGAHPEVADGLSGVRIVRNTRWESGRTSSIQAGLAVMRDADTFLLWPVDACLPGVVVVRALLAARRDHPRAMAWVPSHDKRRGHPALFSGGLIPRLAALTDDAPARQVVRALATSGELVHVEVDDGSVLMNMNTPEDYDRWRSTALQQGSGRFDPL